MRDGARGCVCPPDLPICGCGREPLLRVLTPRVVRPDEIEIEDNPRSASARLRVAERTDAELPRECRCAAATARRRAKSAAKPRPRPNVAAKPRLERSRAAGRAASFSSYVIVGIVGLLLCGIVTLQIRALQANIDAGKLDTQRRAVIDRLAEPARVVLRRPTRAARSRRSPSRRA